ncbi:carboxypeptidase-like regulatory domain-containing protein [Flavobacterium litorale]|uniref:Carboxypeptidase-like regulatory domain-containing protein n=1 Tax=Flavobacterium litorale TaxID=2856519 RepID=A0ABX8V4E7_9FLAO|nr:carboxypeptidase-like regulatory domain-containing protein [Flavobacterium litorale]QYJ67632.1 carboxypeptidase-like regulatory domain-containing protein [Flavobacterium litorale]
MTPKKGRFCASCQKQVHDLTNSSDREIARILNKEKLVCGHIKLEQLNRDLIIPKEKKSLWLAAGATIVSFIGIGTNDVWSQETIQTEVHETNGKTKIKNVEIVPEKDNIITGIVSDQVGMIPGATVINRTTHQETQTNIDGKFTIKAVKGDMIEISYVSFSTEQIVITEKTNYNISLGVILIGEVIIERTFFGRIFYWMGNIFR